MVDEPAREKSPFTHFIQEPVIQGIVKLASLVRASLSKIWYLAQWSLITAWLWLLYGLALWLVLGTMASFHFQTELSAYGSKTGVLDLIKIKRDVTDFDWKIDRISYELVIEDSNIIDFKNELRFSDEDEKPRLYAQIAESEEHINKLEKQKLDIDERIEKLNEKFKVAVSKYDGKAVKVIEELVGDFVYMRDWWSFDILILMPKHLLVLALAISMGALGSVIHLTWEFFDSSKKKTLTWYIFRPLLGGILAFAIFILVKSGQMFVSNSSPSDGSAEGLNPFFISFISIISGMLSEQAYARISAAGSKFLAPPISEVRRYVRQSVLSTLLKDQNKKAADLVRYVQEPPARIKAWFSEQESLSERHQEILAAWLGVSAREIFTDQQADAEDPADFSKEAQTAEEAVEEAQTAEEAVEEAPATKL